MKLKITTLYRDACSTECRLCNIFYMYFEDEQILSSAGVSGLLSNISGWIRADRSWQFFYTTMSTQIIGNFQHNWICSPSLPHNSSCSDFIFSFFSWSHSTQDMCQTYLILTFCSRETWISLLLNVERKQQF